MSYRCDVCDELFTNRPSLEEHKKNCKKDEEDSFSFGPLLGALAVGVLAGGAIYAGVKAAQAIKKRNTDRDSASNSGIASYRGLEFDYEAEAYSPPRLGGIDTDRVDFRSPVTATELNTFIAHCLQPTDAFNREMQTTVGNICDFLREHMRPDRIVKGGSLGKGTSVRGMCDIDLVMFLNEVEGAEDRGKKIRRIREDVKSKLKRNVKGFTIVPGTQTNSKSGLKFRVEGRHGPIKVDLLPTFGFTDRYSKMNKNYGDFSKAAVSESQVEFVKRYYPNVKDLIRLVKYWKKKMVRKFSSDRRIPNSYLMELITIHLWEENARYGNGKFNTLKAFHGIMEALQDYRSLNIFWTENYSASDIPREIRRQRPLVLDPANPTNNVCSGYHWKEIAQEARDVLESPMMEGVSSFSWK